MFKGNWNGTDVALKLLKSEEQLADFEREASLLQYLFCKLDLLLTRLFQRALNHPHVVRYLGIYEDQQKKRYIVTEFMTKGSLSSVVDKERQTIATLDLIRMYITTY